MELLEKEDWEVFHSISTMNSNDSHENFQLKTHWKFSGYQLQGERERERE